MKLTKDEFRRLQKEWYEKLSSSGFIDAEERRGEEFVLRQTANHCYQRYPDRFSIEMKEEYWRCLAHYAEDDTTVFLNDTDKYILKRFAQGAEITRIVRELIAIGSPRSRISIRFIIRKYEMAWGLKHYEPRQLNQKK